MATTVLPRGVIIPLVVPFDADGEVDAAVLRTLTRFYSDVGVQGLFALGSAGQGPAMHPDQRKWALEVIVDAVGNSVPLIAHVGAAESFTGRDLARHAASMGVQAIAIVPPYYYSDFSEYEVHRHFEETAGGAPDLPIVVYDNPRYSGIPMPPPAVARLQKELPNVAGVKMASDGLDVAMSYMRLMPGFSVYAGAIEYLSTGVPFGLAGVINPPTSIFPELCLEVWEAARAGRYEEAFERQKLLNAIRGVVNKFIGAYGRGAFTEVVRLRGFEVKRYPRWTTRALSQQERDSLRDGLIAAGASEFLRQPVAR